MKHLLDVSALIALIWPAHVHHPRMTKWRSGKKLILCPIAELGFLRVSTSPAFNLSMPDARKALADFICDEKPELISDDIRAMDGIPAPTSAKTTDFYLANLAAKHGFKFATFDLGIKHPAVDVVT